MNKLENKEIYSVQDISNYILFRHHELGLKITNLRLQKLIYFAQGLSYMVRDLPAFNEELEAWHYGPVSREIYRQYAHKGSMSILESDMEVMNFNQITNTVNFSKPSVPIIEPELKNAIDVFINNVKDYSDFALVELSHSQSPWINKYDSEKVNVIPNSDIRDFYRKMK